MKKIIKLNESDLLRIIQGVLSEQSLGKPIPSDFGRGIADDTKIIAIQNKLKSLGYNLGTSGPNKDGVDGVYGGKTKLAVQDYQRKNRLIPADGIVGTNTAQKMGVSPLTNDQIRTLKTSGVLKPKSKMTIPSTDKKRKLENVVGQISNRSYNFLQSLKKEGEFNRDTFMIVNKDAAIISLFGPNYKFLGKDSITTGKRKDPGVEASEEGKSLGYRQWHEISIEFAEKKPNHPDSIKIKKYLERYPNAKNFLFSGKKDQEFPKGFPVSYAAAREAGLDYTPSGAFTIGFGKKEKGFEGGDDPNIDNVFHLRPLGSFFDIPASTHGAAGKARQNLIQKASEDGQPIKDYTRAGAGCINVSKGFLKLMNQYEPEWVFILPDNGRDQDVKVTTFDKWSSKLISLGEKCVRSIYDLFV